MGLTLRASIAEQPATLIASSRARSPPTCRYKRVFKHRGKIGRARCQRLFDPGLEAVLQGVVHRLGADVDVSLNAVPRRVVGRKRRLGSRGIALLQFADCLDDSRTHGLDAGDFEPLSLGALSRNGLASYKCNDETTADSQK